MCNPYGHTTSNQRLFSTLIRRRVPTGIGLFSVLEQSYDFSLAANSTWLPMAVFRQFNVINNRKVITFRLFMIFHWRKTTIGSQMLCKVG